MKFLALYKVGVLILVVSFAGSTYAASDKDRTALRNTSEAIRVAFAKGDVATAMRYHHPDVNKALSFHKVLIGRDAVAADLRSTLQQFRLEFVENNVESLLIENKTAVEQTLFTIKEANPFSLKGARWWSMYVTRVVLQAGRPSAR